MHDAGLPDGLRKDGAERVGGSFQAVDDGDQDVADAAVLPEFGPSAIAYRDRFALRLFDPEAEDLLGAVRRDAEGDVGRLVAHEAFVADFDPGQARTPADRISS
jgi:hypothetical protein